MSFIKKLYAVCFFACMTTIIQSSELPRHVTFNENLNQELKYDLGPDYYDAIRTHYKTSMTRENILKNLSEMTDQERQISEIKIINAPMREQRRMATIEFKKKNSKDLTPKKLSGRSNFNLDRKTAYLFGMSLVIATTGFYCLHDFN